MKSLSLDELKYKELRPQSMGLTFKCDKKYYSKYINEILPEKLIKDEGIGKYFKEFERCIEDFKKIKYTSNHVFVFTNLLEEDIYIGSRFNSIKDYDSGEEVNGVSIKVIGIIHEWFLLPYKCINKYHKGLCLLEFEDKIPDIIEGMTEYREDISLGYKNIVLLNRGESNENL